MQFGTFALSALLLVASAAADCDFRPDCRPGETRRVAIPCEGKCAYYYLCEDGAATERKCDKSFWSSQKLFDPVLLECVKNTDCTWWTRVTTTTTTTTTTTAAPAPSEETTLPPSSSSATPEPAAPTTTSTVTSSSETPSSPPDAPSTTAPSSPAESAAAGHSTVTSFIVAVLASSLVLVM